MSPERFTAGSEWGEGGGRGVKEWQIFVFKKNLKTNFIYSVHFATKPCLAEQKAAVGWVDISVLVAQLS